MPLLGRGVSGSPWPLAAVVPWWGQLQARPSLLRLCHAPHAGLGDRTAPTETRRAAACSVRTGDVLARDLGRLEQT